MSKHLVCDLCGEQSDLVDPHFELAVPAAFITQREETILDICSPQCLTEAAKIFSPPTNLTNRGDRKLRRLETNGQVEAGPPMQFTSEVEQRS